MTGEAIVAEALSKRYGDTLALDALDLTVRTGEVYGYLGPNGAGKTTTIRLLLGLRRPSAGRAELFGVDAWRDPVNAHRRAAYVSGKPFLWPAPRARGSHGRRALARRGRARLGRRGSAWSRPPNSPRQPPPGSGRPGSDRSRVRRGVHAHQARTRVVSAANSRLKRSGSSR
jgi:energy-coupling factor transporter ATP-binding protein EcfA2